jgi:hypothetical protein
VLSEQKLDAVFAESESTVLPSAGQPAVAVDPRL